MPDVKSSDLCPRCADPLIPGKLYCANCGLAVIALPDRVPIDAYIEAKVGEALARRLVDQTSLVREIGDKAEDVVWARLKRYTWAVTIALFLLGLYGITSIQEAKSKIVDEARTRLEPVIADTEKRVTSARSEIEKSEIQIGLVKKKLDETSNLADRQSERLTVQGGEIEKKLAGVQEANQRVNVLNGGFEKRVTEYEKQLSEMQARAEQSSQRLEDIQKGFETRVVAVTQQIDNVSIHEAFPGLGQKVYVTFNNKPWRNPAEKKAGEKWVDIFIDSPAWPSISPKQVENLVQALRKRGFTPLVGRFGLGGPYSAGFGALGDNSQAVYYYSQKDQQEASEAAQAVRDNLNLAEMQAKYIDPTKVDQSMRPVLEQSGLDMQIYISNVKR